MRRIAAYFGALSVAVLLTGCAHRAALLAVLPEYCNTPDGMCLLPDNSILVSAPNYNDESKPPLLLRVMPDGTVEKFHEFPTPYPGFPEAIGRIGPMGMARAPSGDIYLADLVYMKDKDQKSRLWRLVLADGKVARMELVAKGFNVANGVAIHGGYCYVTESVLEEGSEPLTSAVLRFRLDESNVTLRTPLKDDPHVITTFASENPQWGFGADGIEFDSRGNLFVGTFGDGIVHKITFDVAGRVTSNTVFAQAPGAMLSCDGMHRDTEDNLYLADSAANAIQVIRPDGTVGILAANPEVTDKRTGRLDQPCEALVRGNEIIVSNMDWPFPGFVNRSHQMPATLSVIRR